MATLYKEVKEKGKKKAIIIIICAAAAIFLAFLIIGITAGNMSEEHEAISAAISENVQLKQMMEDLNAQLDEKQATIDRLQSELDARPTIPPEPTVSPQATPEQQVSPRANR